jgi:hypothetical protein
MNLKYFLENEDLEEYLDSYRKKNIDLVFRNCNKLKIIADEKLNNFFIVYFETMKNLLVSNI